MSIELLLSIVVPLLLTAMAAIAYRHTDKYVSTIAPGVDKAGGLLLIVITIFNAGVYVAERSVARYAEKSEEITYPWTFADEAVDAAYISWLVFGTVIAFIAYTWIVASTCQWLHRIDTDADPEDESEGSPPSHPKQKPELATGEETSKRND